MTTNTSHNVEQLETDYLVIGAGAGGMAFVDELLHRTKDTTFVLIDRLSQPGGHWNHAYSFVRLHQPSYFYGVNSELLEGEKGKIDYASKHEILTYYEKVLRKMLDTGRVVFLSQCDYKGDGKVQSLIASGKTYHVTTRKKVVHSFINEAKVPSTHTPNFTVLPGVNMVPINGLSTLDKAYAGYVVIGNGKTGIDAVLHLLNQGVDPSCIRWIVSRDVWYLNREMFTPKKLVDYSVIITQRLAEDDDPRTVFPLLLEDEILMKFATADKFPEVFRCATITKGELEQVQNIGEFVRLGRVKSIEQNLIHLEKGTLSTGPNILHVDCTANGLPPHEPVPIFDENKIVIQPVVQCITTWSAAIIALLEAKIEEDEAKNALLQQIPHCTTPEDWIAGELVGLKNLDSLNGFQRDIDSMRINPLASAPFFYNLWNMMTKVVPIIPKVLKQAEKYSKK
jgi:hypothetical protein